MKNKRPQIAVATAVCVCAMLSLLTASLYCRSGNHPLSWTGNVRYLPHARTLGQTDPDKVQRAVIGLKLRNTDKLDALLKRQADPSSPDFHQYITPAQFLQDYSPTESDYDQLATYLGDKKNGMGLDVTTYPNRQIIAVRGTAKQLEKAFASRTNKYYGMGDSVPGVGADARLPERFAGIVQSIGLPDESTRFHSHLTHRSHDTVDDGSDGTVWGYSPEQIQRAYNFPGNNNPSATNMYTGKGVTIAIATAYAFDPTDVETYWKQWGIKRGGRVTVIPIAGTTSQLNAETTVDLEQAGAQAPDADILVYEGVDDDSNTFAIGFNQIVVDDKADVVTVSWGDCEPALGAGEMERDENILKQARAQGMVVFSASGDFGAYDCIPMQNLKDADKGPKIPLPLLSPQVTAATSPQLAVDFPSSAPEATSVGGTTLRLDREGGLRRDDKPESAWTSGGGGQSIHFSQPDWQYGPGVPKNAVRKNADLALAADPFFGGYAYYFKGKWEEVGGTSLAAPNVAAAWAALDQAAGRRIGGANPILYRIGRSPDYPRVFRDITSGNNGHEDTGPGYSAGTGWDYPTGWGTPNVTELINWVLKDLQSSAAAPNQSTSAAVRKPS